MYVTYEPVYVYGRWRLWVRNNVYGVLPWGRVQMLGVDLVCDVYGAGYGKVYGLNQLEHLVLRQTVYVNAYGVWVTDEGRESQM